MLPSVYASVQPLPTHPSIPPMMHLSSHTSSRNTLLESPHTDSAHQLLRSGDAFLSNRGAGATHAFSQRTRAAAGESPPRQNAPGATHAPLEMIWDGPRPRLRAPLHIPATGAAPDFACASSRALSTARRLGLELLPELPANGSPLPPRRRTKGRDRVSPEAGGSGSYARTHVVRERVPPGGEDEPDWLDPEQLGFLQVLSGKMRETQSYIARRGPEQAKRATAKLSASWQDAVQQPGTRHGLQRLRAMAPAQILRGTTAEMWCRRQG